ncbi:MAG TPA: class I SAM-dependent methyltransferase [Anaeromyxobacteraceae bacterium]|nr:class I SAM-dependent methyltransferase [Anaeromyxobacteraceae bacterium]
MDQSSASPTAPEDGLLGRLHQRLAYQRRVEVLAGHLAEVLPEGSRVLDVGCGDGLIDRLVQERRPDVRVEGIDVLLRPRTFVPVSRFDGRRIPHADGSVDAVLFVDVLHHTSDPLVLLSEAVRVARRCVVIKDHARDGFLAGPSLRFMDWVGNRRHGVSLPYNYWTEARWRSAFQGLGVTPELWRRDLGLYRGLPHLLFDRSLHFLARLVPAR